MRFAQNTAFLLTLLTTLVLTPNRGFAQPESMQTSTKTFLIHRPRLDTVSLFPFSAKQFVRIHKPKIGLVLSGGGARGLSQIGVLQALDEAGIVPDLIVGTSIGSIVGGLYASGYTVERLKKTAGEIDWSVLMKLSEDTDREFVAIDRRASNDRSIFSIRFDGLKPVLPAAVSNGQHMTNLLNELALQGLYQTTDFDKLKIPFRAVATDLYSGKRVVLRDGSLAQAMRASSTLPVLYAPVERDSLALIDGGLRSNIPVDIARDEGCDIVIAVNTTSPLRAKDQIANPFETLDQVLNIVMNNSYSGQLELADAVIAPPLDQMDGMNFELADSLIKIGYAAARKPAADLAARIRKTTLASSICSEQTWSMPESYRRLTDVEIERILPGSVTTKSLPEGIVLGLMKTNLFADVITKNTQTGIEVYVTDKPGIASIALKGVKELDEFVFTKPLQSGAEIPYSEEGLRDICENILNVYRSYGFSLARIDSLVYNPPAKSMEIVINEGIVGSIRIRGNVRTDPVMILREFPLNSGEIFRIGKAQRGLENISGLNLFHQVMFEVRQTDTLPVICITLYERSSSSLEIGAVINNERNAQLLAEYKEANLLGTGTELSTLFFGGLLNQTYMLHYSTNRVFYTRLQMGLDGYYDNREYKHYVDVDGLPGNRFERTGSYSYERIVYGAHAKLGMYVERFGMFHAGMRYEQHRLRNADTKMYMERFRMVALDFGFTIDTQDKLPYPSEGILMLASYKTSQKTLGSEIPFVKMYVSYDVFFSSFGKKLTIHPHVEFGFGDITMPLTEEFRLGGLNSFFGTRENEFTGRQLFNGSLEVRYLLPIKVYCDTYLGLRYDLGRTWESAKAIQFADLRHGMGITLGIDTPIGPADFGFGKSFIFQSDIDYPISFGPTYIYFSIGVGLPPP